MKWLYGGTLPGMGEEGRSDGRVNDGTERIADDRASSNKGKRRYMVKTCSASRFQRSKSLLTPLRGGR